MSKQKLGVRLPLFLIWPFGIFLTTFFSVKLKSSKVFYILFCVLFGYSFTFVNDSADSYRIAWVFSDIYKLSVSETLDSYLNGNIPDFYKFFLYSFTKIFTQNPKVLFAFFGFFFGAVSFKALQLFLNVKNLERSIYVIILTLVFIALNPITNINGARFWTSAFLCFCAFVKVFFYNDKKWFLGFLILPIIHFSYGFFIPLSLLLYFTKEKLLATNKRDIVFYTYVLMFSASLLLSSNLIDLTVLTKFLPSSIAYKLDLYNSDALTKIYQERAETLFHRVSKFFGYMSRIYLFIIIIIIRNYFKKTQNNKLEKVFYLILIMFIFCFLLSLFPSGGRFLIIATQLFLFFFLRFYNEEKSPVLKRYILGFSFVYSFTILFNIGFLAFSLVSSKIWYGNVFWIIYEGLGYRFIS